MLKKIQLDKIKSYFLILILILYFNCDSSELVNSLNVNTNIASIFDPIISNPSSGYDQPRALAIDDNYIYIAGRDMDNKNFDSQWRIEKRNINTGKLIPEFGYGGVIQSNPSERTDIAIALSVDSNYIYIGGSEHYGSPSTACTPGSEVCYSWYEMRIEKRSKFTGELVDEFGNNGIISSRLGPKDLFFNDIGSSHIDKDFIYISSNEGIDTAGFSGQWRIEKRNKESGELVIEFGNEGKIYSDAKISVQFAPIISIDNNSIYISGKVFYDNDRCLRIEKRDMGVMVLLFLIHLNISMGIMLCLLIQIIYILLVFRE
jgi:hypothetical protein